MSMVARRHLFIVSRVHPSLFEYLREQFSPEADVEIILDRRRAERRRAREAFGFDRRRTDRRTRPEVDAELRSASHVFVSLP